MTVFDKALDFYSKGLWSKEWLRNLVVKGKLTENEYEQITSESYKEQA